MKRLESPTVTGYAANRFVTGRAIQNALWYVEGIPIVAVFDESATGASWTFDEYGEPLDEDDAAQAAIVVDATFVADAT